MLPSILAHPLTPSEALRAKRGEHRPELAGQNLPRQKATNEGTERHTAVGDGLVIAGHLGVRPYTGKPIFRHRTYADASVLDPRSLKRRYHPPGSL